MEMPALDQNICGSWNEQQTDLYNKMPFFLMEAESEYRAQWETYKKVLNPIAWKPNMGDTMRRVMSEPTPVLRQEAYPELISTDPKTDVITYRERTSDAKIRWQDFVSPHYPFLPEFQDFLKHVERNKRNIDRQVVTFEDIFYRTMLFHWAPYVYVAGVGLVEAPMGDPSDDGSTGKTDAWIQAQLTALSGAGPGILSFQEIYKAFNVFETEVGATPFEGTGKPGGDSAPLNERYLFVQSSESWNNLVDDPWLKENRPLNMNIVTESYRGDFWGKVRSRLERFPMRFAADNDFAITRHAPETIEFAARGDQQYRTKPNPSYARISTSQFEIGFLFGGGVGDYIQTGPPPSEFTRQMDQGAATKMQWNGQSYMTKDFLVPCKDGDGNTQYQANSFGRFLRLQATLALGISLINTHNVMPVLYKRKSNPTVQTV
jgi:hypothetical protein